MSTLHIEMVRVLGDGYANNTELFTTQCVCESKHNILPRIYAQILVSIKT